MSVALAVRWGCTDGGGQGWEGRSALGGLTSGPLDATPGSCPWGPGRADGGLTALSLHSVVPAGRLRHSGCWHLAGRHAGELRHPVLLLPVPVGRQPAHRHRHLGHGHRLRGLHRGHQGAQVPAAHCECWRGAWGAARAPPQAPPLTARSSRPGWGCGVGSGPPLTGQGHVCTCVPGRAPPAAVPGLPAPGPSVGKLLARAWPWETQKGGPLGPAPSW